MTIFKSLAIFLALTLPGWAALPLKAIRNYQEKAPERVHLQVTKVQKRSVRRGDNHAFEVTVRATVTSVIRTTSDLESGAEVVIRYTVPNLKKSPAAGDWASIPKAKGRYDAFLKEDDEHEGDYRPAAYSGTFEAIRSGKP